MRVFQAGSRETWHLDGERGARRHLVHEALVARRSREIGEFPRGDTKAPSMIDGCSRLWEHRSVRVYGEAALTKFARKHAASRKPLRRFLEIARAAEWLHFPGVKETFSATDYAPSTGTLIFDIGGNKYRVITRVDFESQVVFIQSVLTHEEYDREDF